MIAPVREWQMGREEEIAYAREHGIPVKGGTEVSRPTRSTTTSGDAPRRAARSRTSRRRRPTTSSSSSPARGRARRAAAAVGSGFEAGCRCRSTASGSGSVELIERAGEIGAAARGRDRRPHRGPDRRPQGPRPLRGAGGGDRARPPTASSRSSSRRSTRTTSSTRSTTSGHTSATPGLWLEPLRSDLDAYMDSANE